MKKYFNNSKTEKITKKDLEFINKRINEVDGRLVNSGSVTINESQVIAKIFNGMKIYLDPRDLSVCPHIILDTIWEPNITIAWNKIAAQGGLIMDIGANYGYYGLIAANLRIPNSKIIFFEPNPTLINYIDKSLSLNWLHEHATIENVAVSNKNEIVQLNIPKGYIGSASLLELEHTAKYMGNKMNLNIDEKVSIDATSIDNYCKRNNVEDIQLIKIDIEGYEDKAYEGMTNTVIRSKNLTMFIEFTKESYKKPEKFFNKLLSDFGNLYTITDEGRIKKAHEPKYEEIIDNKKDWVMPIFSKRPDLEDFND